MRKRLDQIITESIKGTTNANESSKMIEKDVAKIVDAQFDGYEFNHIDYMIDIGSQIYNKTREDYEEQLKEFFIDYCTNILKTFVKKTKKAGGSSYLFDVEKYWLKAYRYNLDVWGFLTSFLVIASEAAENYSRITDEYMKIIDEYLYNPKYATERIPIDEVCESLTKMNDKIREAVDYIKNKKQKKDMKLHRNISKNNIYDDVKVVSIDKPKSLTRKSHKIIVKKTKTKTSSSRNKSNTKTKSITRPKIVSLIGKKCPKGYKRHKTYKKYCVKRL